MAGDSDAMKPSAWIPRHLHFLAQAYQSKMESRSNWWQWVTLKAWKEHDATLSLIMQMLYLVGVNQKAFLQRNIRDTLPYNLALISKNEDNAQGVSLSHVLLILSAFQESFSPYSIT